MRILVSGASGMIGTALVRSSMPNPIHFVRLVRAGGEEKGSPDVETITWNPKATPAFTDLGALSGVTAAVHLAGVNVSAKRWTPEYKQEIVSSRVQTTTALAHALSQVRPLPRVLVCASATGIYGDRGDEALTGDSPPGKGFLADTCVAWEAAAQAAEQAGIRVVHVRFGVVLSPKGGALAKLLPLFRLGLGGNLGNGRQWMPWITLRDVVGVLRYCIDHDEIHGPVNVVAPGQITNAEFTQALGAVLHRPTILPAPSFALKLAFGQMADEALLAGARVLPTVLEGTGYRFLDPEITPALQNLLT